ncbi:hypothetical protein DNJ95_15890 [Stutzerimonas kirkiae]|uniref:Uncharacterized protein n=1 Tax=Stutzerimonas kirkiae TaxID=2211392 RepID=A0A4Q9QYU9_9GAMM|nr:ABC transporter permease subunit [Stutzerimonas kirkiae]TBU90664.1 hypothetical protein DNJ96_16685 [Stutzerimonas kirkiae]TBV00176.1 hypothetical protein DNJ95_15890 [Stutzerimonas kirkiae]
MSKYLRLYLPDRMEMTLSLRTNCIKLYAVSAIITSAAATLFSSLSPRQPMTMALDMGISAIRLITPLFISLLAHELIFNEFNRRQPLIDLAYPLPRHALLIRRFAATFILCLALLPVLAIPLAASAFMIGHGQPQGTPPGLGLPFLLTLSFIAAEACVLCALATLLATVTSTPGLILVGTLGFTLIARSQGTLDGLPVTEGGPADSRAGPGLLHYLLPDLGLLDVRMITLYDKWEFLEAGWQWSIISALCYAMVLLGLALWSVQRKDFP